MWFPGRTRCEEIRTVYVIDDLMQYFIHTIQIKAFDFVAIFKNEINLHENKFIVIYRLAEIACLPENIIFVCMEYE